VVAFPSGSPVETTGSSAADDEPFIRKIIVIGNPDPDHISTSLTERHNLTMRTHMRRFVRRTNAFSKRVYYHACMVALYTVYYNFVRIHKTLRITPAMAAGIKTRLWSVADIVALIDARAGPPKKRGPYKPRRPEPPISN
jgi:hypothetical protein